MKKIILAIVIMMITNSVQSQALEGSQVLDYSLPTSQNGIAQVRVNFDWKLSVFQGSIVLSYDSECNGSNNLNYRGKTYTGYSSSDNLSYEYLQEKIRDIKCTDPTVSIKITGPGVNKRVQVQVHEGKSSGSGFGSINSLILGNASSNGVKDFDVIVEHVVSVLYLNTQPAYAEIEKILSEKEKKEKLDNIKKLVSEKINNEDPTGAMADLRSAKNLFPNDPWINEKIKEVEQIQKKQKEDLVKKNNKAEADKLKSQANTQIKQKNYAGARDLLKKAEKLNPEDDEIPEIFESLEALGSTVNTKENSKSSSASSSNDDFWNDKPSNNTSSSRSKTKEQLDAEAYQDAMQKQQAYTDNFMNSIKEQKEKEERSWVAREQSFYAAERLRNAKNNLSQGSTLSKDHSSIESLEREFQQKMNAVNNLVSEQVAAKNQKWQTDVQNAYRNSNETDKAFGELVSTFGTLINSASAKSEERYRKEKLEKERAELKKKLEAEMAEEKAKLMREFRVNLINQFPEGGVPLSKDKIPVNELYFFAYIYDPAKINNMSPDIFITNTFPIAQYNDGTWPFKNAITSELQKTASVSNGKLVLVGYYGSEETAEEYRKSLIDLSIKSGFVQKDLVYKGKKATSVQKNTDFWETGTKKDEKKDIKKKDDFWNN
ncbi:hypothetical protein [Flavobacterium orientale]|uniref:Tetratricopeptide repeat-containing protein n=1 Tax=Flavobacterium orientale TaxID=1756020 RepID=A0A916XVV8_9FLAO|nr:hypothetical protein [Flavobacterium orientale]GGD14896.1 hypothetical protein GCM10011343_02400 [Flavobacterium orientale]